MPTLTVRVAHVVNLEAEGVLQVVARLLGLQAGHHGRPLALPVWDPVNDARARLTDAEALSSDAHTFLLEWCDRLAPQIADLNARQPARLIHGDAHVGNYVTERIGWSYATSTPHV